MVCKFGLFHSDSDKNSVKTNYNKTWFIFDHKKKKTSAEYMNGFILFLNMIQL